jgi:Transmembrane domain of unknown function (DUF3566)
VRRVDVASVAKVSIVFYLLVLVVVVVASLMLWYVADAFGALSGIERSIRTLFDLKKFTVHPAMVAGYTCLGGTVLAAAGTLANVLAAVMYNLISDVVGGIRLEIDDNATPYSDRPEWAGHIGSGTS